MTRFLIIGGLCAAVSSAALSQAATPPKPIPRAQYLQLVDNRFNSIDTNHDGKATKEEFEALRQRDLQQAKATITKNLQDAFKRLDTNHDGKLTLEEFMATAPAIHTTETADQMIQRLDTNHDGKVTADEFRAPEMAKFNKVDANHDGIVTPQEIEAARGK